ncbi:MAG TPA: hypothetical protein PLA83_02210 [Deltaproteobacteria bacterium]|jgi:hypothetical protein|nr:hypothetical protein [Deltaproteobacteria bacterium]HQI01583.1 hypothetical protein [Deltaproteobacteria bacterium]HQJ08786.1 hypothetical protein [Deltaproteobacteria bacterium]
MNAQRTFVPAQRYKRRNEVLNYSGRVDLHLNTPSEPARTITRPAASHSFVLFAVRSNGAAAESLPFYIRHEYGHTSLAKGENT